MKRNIYLEGDLGTEFGAVHSAVADTAQDALKTIEANFPLFRNYLVEAHEAGLEFSISVEDEYIDEPEGLLYPLKEGDIIITPVVAGAKSGGAKLLTAMAMFAVLLIPGGAAFIPGLQSGSMQSIFAAASIKGGLAGFAATMAMSIATNLALSGISQIMAPDPSVDKEEEAGYLYQGSTSNIIEGDPVPLFYGELRIPGQPISIAVKSVSATEDYTINPEEAEYIDSAELDEYT